MLFTLSRFIAKFASALLYNQQTDHDTKSSTHEMTLFVQSSRSLVIVGSADSSLRLSYCLVCT